MNKYNLGHSFVVCAYKESPFLEECVQSIMTQTVKSEVLIATSTPNAYIAEIADKYQIPLYVNTGEKGITQDWNFAYGKAMTDLVTIAHQDDVYLPQYVEKILKSLEGARGPLIAFTDYGELRNNDVVKKNRILIVKRILLFPLRFRLLQKSIFVRRRSLSLGNCICCPAVTFVKKNLPEQIFRHGFRSNEDWEAWEYLSKIKGEFVYTKEIGMYHRIHSGSETSAIINDNARTTEDLAMFEKFWPKSIAKLMSKVYAVSEDSNELK